MDGSRWILPFTLVLFALRCQGSATEDGLFLLQMKANHTQASERQAADAERRQASNETRRETGELLARAGYPKNVVHALTEATTEVGQNAPLTEAGYTRVALNGNETDMVRYAQRVLAEEGHRVKNKKALKKALFRFYNVTDVTENFIDLKNELHGLVLIEDPSLREKPIRRGRDAPLTEDGYYAVVNLKSDIEMSDYMLKVLHADGRFAKDHTTLHDRAPHYSGTKDAKSFAALQAELKSADWVRQGVGRFAPLTEEGYRKVAAHQSDAQMTSFGQRIASDVFGKELSEEALQKIVPFFSGTLSVQDFVTFKRSVKASIKDEHQSVGNKGFIRESTGVSMLQIASIMEKADTQMLLDAPSAASHSLVEALARVAKTAVWDTAEGAEMAMDEKLLACQTYVETARCSWTMAYSCNGQALGSKGTALSDGTGVFDCCCTRGLWKTVPELLLITFPNMVAAHPGSGNETTLDADGYATVTILKDDEEFKDFVRRVLAAEGREVVDNSFLSGLAPYYSGKRAVQSFPHLLDELHSAPWIYHGLGRNVSLTQDGYEEVAEHKDDVQMKAFALRVLSDVLHMGLQDEHQLDGLIPYFSGNISVQDLETLKSELQQGVEASEQVAVEAPAPVVQRALAASLIASQEPAIGSNAPLTEEGYQAVAKLKSDKEMKKFAKRFLHSQGRSCKDEASLNGFVAFFSGNKAVQTLDAMQKNLAIAAWVGHGIGRKAPFSDKGYQEVATTRRDVQMMAYAKRLLAQLHLASSVPKADDAQLAKMIPFFSGRKSSQDFSTLQDELMATFGKHDDAESALDDDVDADIADDEELFDAPV